MTGAMLAAVLALGIDSGWQKLPENEGGGYEYVIQIDPQTLELLKKGEPIFSDIPPGLRGIRSYRILVGTGTVPREGNPEETPAATPAVALAGGVAPQLLANDTFSKPLSEPQGTPPKQSEPATTPKAEDATETPPATPQRWMPLTLAVAALLGSIGGNLYLGWLTWEMRGRFRRLLHRSHGGEE